MPPDDGMGRLLFLHIPKASGTTLRSIIERQYPGGAVYRTTTTAPPAIAAALARHEERAERPRCVIGHMRFGLHRHLDGAARYITMLRHPVRRLVSHYDYVQRTRGHYLHDEVAGGGLTLGDYVASGVSTELNDGQVRQLCGSEGAGAVPYGQVSEAMLEAAKTNLQRHFVAVGITERFDESLLLFQKLLGWGSVQYEAENTAPRRGSPALSEATTALILRYNALDLRLYDFARELLAGALAAHGIDAGTLARFRARNFAYRAGRFTARLLGAAGRSR